MKIRKIVKIRKVSEVEAHPYGMVASPYDPYDIFTVHNDRPDERDYAVMPNDGSRDEIALRTSNIFLILRGAKP